MNRNNKLRRWTAAALAVFMMAAMCSTSALAAALTQPSFSVEHEVDIYRQPSDLIPCGHAGIITLAASITDGKSGDAEKTEAIYTWAADHIWCD